MTKLTLLSERVTNVTRSHERGLKSMFFVFWFGFFSPRYFGVAVIPVFLVGGICIYTFVSKWYFRCAVAVVVVLSILLQFAVQRGPALLDFKCEISIFLYWRLTYISNICVCTVFPVDLG